MPAEPPIDRLRRRIGATPDRDADDPEDPDADDPDSLLPQWIPDAPAEQGWLAAVRADPGRAGAVALAAIAAIAVLVTVFTLLRDPTPPVTSAKLPTVAPVPSDDPPSTVAEPAAAADAAAVVVSVVGLVQNPGLASLPPGARVADALIAAGGALDGADTLGLNLARQLADGEQIVVGITAPPGRRSAPGSSVRSGRGPDGDIAEAPRTTAARPPGGRTAPGAPAGGPVNLNTATVEQLDTLPGVGPVTAAAIIAWREAHGPFRSVEQLVEVDGIGPARLERLRMLVGV